MYMCCGPVDSTLKKNNFRMKRNCSGFNDGIAYKASIADQHLGDLHIFDSEPKLHLLTLPAGNLHLLLQPCCPTLSLTSLSCLPLKV